MPPAGAFFTPAPAGLLPPSLRLSRIGRGRFNSALALSLLAHALLLSVALGGQTFGVPGLNLPWKERRLGADDLRVVLAPVPVPPAAPPAPAPVSVPAPVPVPVPRPAPPMQAAQGAVAPARAEVTALPPPASADDGKREPVAQAAREEAHARQLRQIEREADALREAARLAQRTRDDAAAAQADRLAVAERLALERAEATRREEALREQAQADAARQAADRQEAQTQEAARRELARQEAASQEAASQEAARNAAARAALARQEAARQEAAGQEAARLDAAKRETARHELARQEAARQEAAKQDAAGQEAARIAQVQRERAAQEAEREERLRAIGRQLNQEAAGRDAARSTPTTSSLRRGWMFGRADANADLVAYAQAMGRKIEMNQSFDSVRDTVKQPHTQPVVTVAIRADGSVEKVTFVVSSGVAAIDGAIGDVIASQAPYGPFPPALARQYDVIEIRRTWIFDVAIRLQ